MNLTSANVTFLCIAVAGCASVNGGLPVVLAQPVKPTVAMVEPVIAARTESPRRPRAATATPKKPPTKAPPLVVVAKVARPVAPAARVPDPPLDVAALKLRLKNTEAIGLFTKLALKNQVDDLLQQFRAHYLDGQTTSVAKLRPPYDLLVLKVLALLQDNDPPLAHTISGSREAIWGILADPEKFKLVI